MVRRWYTLRFGGPKKNPGYYKEWKGRFARYCAIGQMDEQSRELWMQVNRESDFGRIIHQNRGVPEAYIGQIVEMAGIEGYIVGHNGSANLNVYFPSKKQTYNCHPHWNIKYYAKGEVVREFGA